MNQISVNTRHTGPYKCRCGDAFKDKRHLTEHIGLQNPHWPKTRPSDEHQWTNDPYRLGPDYNEGGKQ